MLMYTINTSVHLEPSTSAGINPNDYLRLETNDVHIVQSVHSFLGSRVSQTNRTKINTRGHGDLSLLSCINRNRLTWSWPICYLLWGSLRLCTCFWSTSVLVWIPDPLLLIIYTPGINLVNRISNLFFSKNRASLAPRRATEGGAIMLICQYLKPN
jgi:hypothetical protein